MADKRIIVTFSLTKRAAAIAEGWQLNRSASRIISKLIENQADGLGFDLSLPGDKRTIKDIRCIKSITGQWMVRE
jgi:hypothetical protein